MRSAAAASAAAIRRHGRLLALLTALVFALAYLATPLGAADPEADRVLVPGHVAVPGAPSGGAAGSGPLTLVGVVILAGAGAWLLWRKRTNPVAGRVARQLVVDETRSLGNRQFLVVASYRDKKFLLGVCPGRIDLLAPLHEGATETPTGENS